MCPSFMLNDVIASEPWRGLPKVADDHPSLALRYFRFPTQSTLSTIQRPGKTIAHCLDNNV